MSPGLTMAAMGIVNNPGDWDHVYAPLRHAEWNGWTPTDLIFPFFVFIVGVSITFSKRSLGWGTILKRSALIFALGLLLNARSDLSTWRIPGVLQRIAICYAAAAAIFKVTADRRRQALLVASTAVAAIAAYYLLLTFVEPPGGVRGDLSPEGNLGAHIDRALFGRHMWQPRWDPEGLLSTLPAIGTALFGVVAWLWLRSTADPGRKAAVLALAACGILALRVASWFLSQDLWTSSFVLFTAAPDRCARGPVLADRRARLRLGRRRSSSRHPTRSHSMWRRRCSQRCSGSPCRGDLRRTYVYETWFVPLRRRKTRRSCSPSRSS